MSDRITIDPVQFQKLIATIDALAVPAPYWKHFFIAAVPIFLASLLGLSTAMLLDWLKTRREKRTSDRERLEHELSLLSGANTAIAFNIESLVHTVLQQILPHHQASQAACAALEAVQTDPRHAALFYERLHSEFHPVMKRCPLPYLEDLNLFRDLPFLIARDPRLISTSGWIKSRGLDLTNVPQERNRMIGVANEKDLSHLELERHIATQATISDVEVINSYFLLQHLEDASGKIEKIIKEDYCNVAGPKLAMAQCQRFSCL